MKQLVVLRVENRADLAAAPLDVGDGNAVIAHAAQEIVRAVDGIHDPDPLVGAAERSRGFLA